MNTDDEFEEYRARSYSGGFSPRRRRQKQELYPNNADETRTIRDLAGLDTWLRKKETVRHDVDCLIADSPSREFKQVHISRN